ncbi:MAG: hypothetical protein KDC92_09745 [Bacteroidetes bacterium]|nr:hypothetical protein [Bacteroidota bacterium]
MRLKITFEKDATIMRVVDVPKDKNLEFLHLTILACLELSPGEITSFWLSDNNWGRTVEIPLIQDSTVPDDGKEHEKMAVMEDVPIAEAINEHMPKLIYEYDPMIQWSFKIEFIEYRAESDQFEYPILVQENGKAPDHNLAKIAFINQLEDNTSDDEDIFSSGGGFLDHDDDYDFYDED